MLKNILKIKLILFYRVLNRFYRILSTKEYFTLTVESLKFDIHKKYQIELLK